MFFRLTTFAPGGGFMGICLLTSAHGVLSVTFVLFVLLPEEQRILSQGDGGSGALGGGKTYNIILHVLHIHITTKLYKIDHKYSLKHLFHNALYTNRGYHNR